jgi:hypothetical protein
MSFDDELLLTTLGGALETRAAEPSADELDAFRALLRGDGGEILPFPQPVDRRAGHRRGRTVLVAAALAASLAIAGGAGALATGTTLPNVLRAPVRALGINVDDTAVAQTRSAMKELRSALDGTDDARVQAAALALAAQLRTLSVSDFAEVEAEARALLQVAESRLSPGLGRVRTETAVPSPTAPVSVTDPAPSGDDVVAGASGSGSRAIGSEAPEVETPVVETPEIEPPVVEAPDHTAPTPTVTTEPGDDSEHGTVDD